MAEKPTPPPSDAPQIASIRFPGGRTKNFYLPTDEQSDAGGLGLPSLIHQLTDTDINDPTFSSIVQTSFHRATSESVSRISPEAISSVIPVLNDFAQSLQLSSERRLEQPTYINRDARVQAIHLMGRLSVHGQTKDIAIQTIPLLVHQAGRSLHAASPAERRVRAATSTAATEELVRIIDHINIPSIREQAIFELVLRCEQTQHKILALGVGMLTNQALEKGDAQSAFASLQSPIWKNSAYGLQEQLARGLRVMRQQKGKRQTRAWTEIVANSPLSHSIIEKLSGKPRQNPTDAVDVIGALGKASADPHVKIAAAQALFSYAHATEEGAPWATAIGAIITGSHDNELAKRVLSRLVEIDAQQPDVSIGRKSPRTATRMKRFQDEKKNLQRWRGDIRTAIKTILKHTDDPTMWELAPKDLVRQGSSGKRDSP